MVDIPDARLDALAAAVNPKKVVPAQVRVVDAPLGSRAQRVATAREADVVVKVVRCFGPDPDPAGELAGIELDLALADLATVEKRLEVVEKEVRAGKKERQMELDVLNRARAQLDGGAGLAGLELSADERALLAPLFPVSMKPAVVVANVADELLPSGGEAARLLPGALILSARLEQELGELDEAEAADYRVAYGLSRSGLATLAREVWDAGGLITFFTAGEPEARAWACPRDAPAPQAAGVIHSDFEKSFIKAEVTSVDELVAAGSMDALRAAGKLRLEGRDYRIQDGDVVLFRVGR
jgi:ribosome-binding ATPase YchF (GTP1/OBG family)